MNRTAAEIFHEARELPTQQRVGFLKGACGTDLALRKKVEMLLKADSEAGGFMVSPAAGEVARPEAAPSQEQAARRSAATSCSSRSARAAWARSGWRSSANPSSGVSR